MGIGSYIKITSVVHTHVPAVRDILGLGYKFAVRTDEIDDVGPIDRDCQQILLGDVDDILRGISYLGVVYRPEPLICYLMIPYEGYLSVV